MAIRTDKTQRLITIGASLEALKFAYHNKTKLVCIAPEPPFIFEASYKKEMWNLLYMKLSLEGSLIGGDSVVSVLVKEDILTVACKYNIINKVPYDALYVFEDKDIHGLPSIKKKNQNIKVIDILKPNSMSSPHLNYIKTNDELVNEIYIHKDNQCAPIEIYVLSSLVEKQLFEFDYSDTVVKFKTEDILKKNNFTGRRNGTSNIPLNLSVTHREVIKYMDIYEDSDKIKFMYGK